MKWKYTKQSDLHELTGKQTYDALKYIKEHRNGLLKDYYGTKKAVDWQTKYQAVMFLRRHGLVETYKDTAEPVRPAYYQLRMRLTSNGKKVLNRLTDIERMLDEGLVQDEEEGA